MLSRLLTLLFASILLSGIANAQDLPKTHFKIIGSNSPTVASTVDEIPFWTKTVPADSKGAVTADVTPIDQMGIDDKTMLRMLKLGVMDIGNMDISKMAGDDPRFEGCDLAGLTLTPDQAFAACDAWRPIIDRQMQKNWNTKLLAIGGNPPQVFWCRQTLTGLADLKGRKIRVFNNTMRDFMQGIGAASINMSFAEVVPALNNGVVDCAVTGTLSGNTAGWPEVTKVLYPLSLGWSIKAVAINLTVWNKLPPAVQAFLTKEMKISEEGMWNTIREATAQGINCNIGKEPCTLGKMAHMTAVPISDEDRVRYKSLVESAVLTGWAKRCGAECAKEWNATVGKALGLQVPMS